MSQTADGQRIACDGEGCKAVAYLPVGLRSVLAQAPTRSLPAADGWLFVCREGPWRHFCPQCAPRWLLRDESEAPDRSLARVTR